MTPERITELLAQLPTPNGQPLTNDDCMKVATVLFRLLVECGFHDIRPIALTLSRFMVRTGLQGPPFSNSRSPNPF